MKKQKNKTENRNSQSNESFEEMSKLVHLLQVHQVELEHQNHELRLAQEELEASRNKYVNLFDFSPIPYFTLNNEGKIRDVNLNAAKMLGIDRKNLISKNFNTFIPLMERDKLNLFIRDIFNFNIKQTCEIAVINKKKEIFNVRLEGLAFEDENEEEIKCEIALIDLTAIKKIENELIKTNESLNEINNNIDKFFSIIAHDLRSPIHSLLGISELLENEIETLTNKEIVLFVKGLNLNLKNLFVLLDNLLNWSLLQMNKLQFNPVNLEISTVIQDVIEKLNFISLKKNITIINKFNKKTVVYADKEMLRSIIQNLLVNAIKFSNKDGEIIIKSQEKKRFVEISVIDNGVGIEPEIASNIFNFKDINSTKGTEGEKGTGLGLQLCKDFVEKNGGSIWVESEPGKGSKFIFTVRKLNN